MAPLAPVEAQAARRAARGGIPHDTAGGGERTARLGRPFADYRLRIAQLVRNYGVTPRVEAPVDSRAAHDDTPRHR